MKNLRNYTIVLVTLVFFASCEKEPAQGNANTNSMNQATLGEGGSMAQFTILGNYLYTVDYKSLKVFHLADPANPELLETVNLGVGIETIFPQNDHLFIGTQSGVRIYDVTNPRQPEQVSRFDHVTSCDPVVANDEYALATLRGGTPCNGNVNQLDLIDISDITNPTLISSTELLNPYGLGLAENSTDLVYICDGYAGVKAFDISNPEMPEQVMHLEGLDAIDVIPDTDNNLIVLTRQGVYQYDATNPLELTQKSVISVE